MLISLAFFLILLILTNSILCIFLDCTISYRTVLFLCRALHFKIKNYICMYELSSKSRAISRPSKKHNTAMFQRSFLCFSRRPVRLGRVENSAKPAASIMRRKWSAELHRPSVGPWRQIRLTLYCDLFSSFCLDAQFRRPLATNSAEFAVRAPFSEWGGVYLFLGRFRPVLL